ncbi:MAG TPA: ATP-binding protein [Actinomycetota bacterium]|nr:ATP-binding protein [Actinomycetota bacterium]
MDTTATLPGPATDVDECRRLAELLDLDAVGVVRADHGHRRAAWWAAPGTEVSLDRILDGSASGWIAFPRGDHLVFAHLADGGPTRSVTALSTLLSSIAEDGPSGHQLGGVAPDDPIERERTRLAYAIHDGLTQVVTASVIELEWHARRTELEPAEAVDALHAAAVELRKALEEIRRLLAGLSSKPGTSAQPFEDLIQGVLERWQLPATWTIDGDLHALPRPVLDVASTVIRESVANAAKHASPATVAVAVHARPGELELVVEDRGRGFVPAGTGSHAGHLGLEMMRRRVAEVNGTLDIQSSPGKGTRVVARLPVPAQGVKP